MKYQYRKVTVFSRRFEFATLFPNPIGASGTGALPSASFRCRNFLPGDSNKIVMLAQPSLALQILQNPSPLQPTFLDLATQSDPARLGSVSCSLFCSPDSLPMGCSGALLLSNTPSQTHLDIITKKG